MMKLGLMSVLLPKKATRPIVEGAQLLGVAATGFMNLRGAIAHASEIVFGTISSRKPLHRARPYRHMAISAIAASSRQRIVATRGGCRYCATAQRELASGPSISDGVHCFGYRGHRRRIYPESGRQDPEFQLHGHDKSV